jgi:hypothetical protein
MVSGIQGGFEGTRYTLKSTLEGTGQVYKQGKIDCLETKDDFQEKAGSEMALPFPLSSLSTG